MKQLHSTLQSLVFWPAQRLLRKQPMFRSTAASMQAFFTNIRRVKTPLLRRLAAVHITESASTWLKISATV